MISTQLLFEKINNTNKKFVIHLHKKSDKDIHFDIRLEKDGVLKSFATRKLEDLIQNKTNKIQLFPTPDHDYNEWINFSGKLSGQMPDSG